MRLAALVLLLASCGPDPKFARECSELYERCVDDASTFKDYLECRELVDRRCLR